MSLESVKLVVLDYGSGNVGSVRAMLDRMKVNYEVGNSPELIVSASHILLPGVGAFAAAMQKISSSIPVDLLANKVLHEKTPFLGICVGMQVLASTGTEFGTSKGLGWIPGTVRPIPVSKLSLPHMGWNNLIDIDAGCPLFESISNDNDFYFVHSYFFDCEPQSVQARFDYGDALTACVQSGNVFGVQFHPEKSQQSGMKVMRNFLRYKHA